MKKDWKTTSAGIMAIIGGAINLYFYWSTLTPENITASFTAILTGVGLIFAKDFNHTDSKPPNEITNPSPNKEL